MFPRVLFTILWIPLSYCIVGRLCEHGLLMVAPPCSLFVPISASVHRRQATLSRANNNFMIVHVLSNFGVSAYGSMTSSSFKLYMHGDLPLNQGWATLWEHKQQASENVYPHCPELWNPDQPHFVLATDHPADCWAAKGFYALEAANLRFLDSSVRFELCAHLLGFFRNGYPQGKPPANQYGAAWAEHSL